MNFKTFYRGLGQPDREAFAERAGTTVGYLENHLIPARKVPKRDLMSRLAEASEGSCTFEDILDHFYGPAAEGPHGAALS